MQDQAEALAREVRAFKLPANAEVVSRYEALLLRLMATPPS